MKGLLPASGENTISNIGASFRATLSLTSTSPNRAIELSINDGQDYFPAQLDVEEDGVIGVVLKGAVTNIRFIGEENDEWAWL